MPSPCLNATRRTRVHLLSDSVVGPEIRLESHFSPWVTMPFTSLLYPSLLGEAGELRRVGDQAARACCLTRKPGEKGGPCPQGSGSGTGAIRDAQFRGPFSRGLFNKGRWPECLSACHCISLVSCALLFFFLWHIMVLIYFSDVCVETL